MKKNFLFNQIMLVNEFIKALIKDFLTKNK